ncbi:MAG: hypothetical protein MKZ73_02470 [Alphaproteobacteria bacterium]|jgi:hypothetical protein|nr:hypothetical protein [Alphaproteobacteria bacterium]|tara:strand:+ start:857 stop:1075 length:219 start_codon:yes stop_codon:yes gene_type:complete
MKEEKKNTSVLRLASAIDSLEKATSVFGLKISGISKDLKDVHLENESIKKSNSEASLKLGKVIEKIKLGLGK